jgi:hypothetical protein
MKKIELKHLSLNPDIFGKSEKYTPKPWNGHKLPERDRIAHADKLFKEFQSIITKSNPAIEGFQIEFHGQSNSYLETKSLESQTQGIYLLNQRNIKSKGSSIPVATVYFPRGKPNAFLARQCR